MNMFRTKWFGALAGAMVLALSVVSAASAAELYRSPEVSSAAAAPAPTWLANIVIPPMLCNAWVVTNYWSDASHTTKVGQCSITCAQYDQGDDLPLPNSGATCTGVTSSTYTNQLTSPCRCVP
jgi:hypothetical protein